MFVCACKSFDPVSEGCGDLMLFRLISLPPPPLETCLCSDPSILFTALLHPYRTNDHGSGQLLNAVVSSALLSDSSSIALDGTQMHLVHTSPPHLADPLMWFRNTSVKVYQMCPISQLQCMITRHITFGVYDYRQGSYNFSLLITALSNIKVLLSITLRICVINDYSITALEGTFP